MDESISDKHSLIIENREKLIMNGVQKVISFDDETILLQTNLGKISIKGENLHIDSFNNEVGELSAKGKINAVIYMSNLSKDTSLISKIFR